MSDKFSVLMQPYHSFSDWFHSYNLNADKSHLAGRMLNRDGRHEDVIEVYRIFLIVVRAGPIEGHPCDLSFIYHLLLFHFVLKLSFAQSCLLMIGRK